MKTVLYRILLLGALILLSACGNDRGSPSAANELEPNPNDQHIDPNAFGGMVPSRAISNYRISCGGERYKLSYFIFQKPDANPSPVLIKPHGRPLARLSVEEDNFFIGADLNGDDRIASQAEQVDAYFPARSKAVYLYIDGAPQMLTSDWEVFQAEHQLASFQAVINTLICGQ